MYNPAESYTKLLTPSARRIALSGNALPGYAIGGLIFSTFLTLFVVPAVYTLLADAKMLSSCLVGAES